MTTCVLWLTLMCVVVGVVTSESGGPHKESGNSLKDFVRAFIAKEKKEETSTPEKRQWSSPNWDQVHCTDATLRDMSYNANAWVQDVLPVHSGCGKRLDMDGTKRSLVQEFLRDVLDLDDDLDLEDYLDLDKKVVGGVESDPGEWPWQAAIGKKSTCQTCGGSLIADKWVLTAAHCFEEEDWWSGKILLPDLIRPCDYNVRMGEHSLSGNWENHIDATPAMILVHPDYNSHRVENDIALIKLDKAVPIFHIHVVCLPARNDFWLPGSKCMVSGWGDTTGSGDAPSDVLRHAELTVMETGSCSRTFYWNTLAPGVGCAGVDIVGPSACDGDSGGALVCKKGSRFVQAGIVSYGSSFCNDFPMVYTDVTYFRQWIQSVVGRKGLW